jgi:2,4-dienoyl-CoA reductase-like NADH-dependent reductase (Old Yellow Enzyme family)
VQTRNRIMMSPMCQYSAENGLASEWHFAHLAARAVGCAGVVCVEACHVESRTGQDAPEASDWWCWSGKKAIASAVRNVGGQKRWSKLAEWMRSGRTCA